MEIVREDAGSQARPSKLWRTVKAIYGKSSSNADNEAITVDYSQVSSPKPIANYFNSQFTNSKIGRHTSSSDTRIVSREKKAEIIDISRDGCRTTSEAYNQLQVGEASSQRQG